jgi:eukaryotic-like serine/threonine-protein kinase
MSADTMPSVTPNDAQDPHDAQTTLSMGMPSRASETGVPQRPVSIGRYRVLRLLGAGGMGVVYEAEQEEPRRAVALKVIRSIWASPELLRRFQQESQALARHHHPGIAQIYEAGTGVADAARAILAAPWAPTTS